ncbi:hypothetical protein Q8A73_017935 [Channa argus]|nr:hypothetical protein Q8A73_017935 [Channa argus]
MTHVQTPAFIVTLLINICHSCSLNFKIKISEPGSETSVTMCVHRSTWFSLTSGLSTVQTFRIRAHGASAVIEFPPETSTGALFNMTQTTSVHEFRTNPPPPPVGRTGSLMQIICLVLVVLGVEYTVLVPNPLLHEDLNSHFTSCQPSTLDTLNHERNHKGLKSVDSHLRADTVSRSPSVAPETRQDPKPAARPRTAVMPRREDTSTESHNYEPQSRNAEESLAHME